MRFWRNRYSKLAFQLCVIFFFGLIRPVHAGSILIDKADARLNDDGYQLSAVFDIQLSTSIEMALHSGVTLHFVSKFSLSRSRWYWFDTDVIQEEQVSKLTYNILTQQYRVSRGSLYQSFYEKKDAIKVLGQIIGSPISPETMKKTGGGYISRVLKKGSECCLAAVTMYLDVSQLPKPMQVNALANEEWKLESGLYRWKIDIPRDDSQ